MGATRVGMVLPGRQRDAARSPRRASDEPKRGPARPRAPALRARAPVPAARPCRKLPPRLASCRQCWVLSVPVDFDAGQCQRW